MKLTQNYSLKKPDLTDVADIEVLNGNMDIIDSQFKNFSTLLDNKLDKNGIKVELSLYPNIQGKATMIKYQNNMVFTYIDGIQKNNGQKFTDYFTNLATIPAGFRSDNQITIHFNNIGWYSNENIFIETAHIHYAGSILKIVKPSSQYAARLNGNFFYQCN